VSVQAVATLDSCEKTPNTATVVFTTANQQTIDDNWASDVGAAMSTQESNAHRPEPETPAHSAGWILALARIEELRYQLQRVRCEACGDSDSFGRRQPNTSVAVRALQQGGRPGGGRVNGPNTAARLDAAAGAGGESPLALQRSVGSIIEGGG